MWTPCVQNGGGKEHFQHKPAKESAHCDYLTHYLYAAVLPWSAEAGNVPPSAIVDSDRLLQALDESCGQRREDMQAFYWEQGYFTNAAAFVTALGRPAPRRMVAPTLFRVALRRTLTGCCDVL